MTTSRAYDRQDTAVNGEALRAYRDMARCVRRYLLLSFVLAAGLIEMLPGAEDSRLVVHLVVYLLLLTAFYMLPSPSEVDSERDFT